MVDGSNNAWVDQFGLTYPVFEDHDYAVTGEPYTEGGSIGLPNFSVLDRNLEVVARFQAGGISDNQILQLLDQPIPDVERLEMNEIPDGAEIGPIPSGPVDGPGPVVEGDGVRNPLNGEGVNPLGAGCTADQSRSALPAAPVALGALMLLSGLVLRRRF